MEEIGHLDQVLQDVSHLTVDLVLLRVLVDVLIVDRLLEAGEEGLEDAAGMRNERLQFVFCFLDDWAELHLFAVVVSASAALPRELDSMHHVALLDDVLHCVL